MMSQIIRPEMILYFLVPGRLVSDGVVINYHWCGIKFEFFFFASLINPEHQHANEFM